MRQPCWQILAIVHHWSPSWNLGENLLINGIIFPKASCIIRYVASTEVSLIALMAMYSLLTFIQVKHSKFSTWEMFHNCSKEHTYSFFFLSQFYRIHSLHFLLYFLCNKQTLAWMIYWLQVIRLIVLSVTQHHKHLFKITHKKVRESIM